MANINRCIFTGRVVRDAEVRTTASGKEVVTFSLAVNRPRKTADGWEDETSFLDCEKWCDDGSYFERKLRKGARICIESRAKQERFQSKTGENRTKVKFTVDSIDVLDSAPDDQPRASSMAATDIPF